MAKDDKQRKKRRRDGRDEMNLAEFPFASLARRDEREAIVFEGWYTDKQGRSHHQKWIASGDVTAGLPTEGAERFLLACLYVATQQNFEHKRMPCSVYQLLKIMGKGTAKKDYKDAERWLKQLVGLTIYSENAFWDHEQKKRINTSTAFHLIEEIWLRYKENGELEEDEDAAAYILWSDRIWDSFKAGYIKKLDIDFFYSLSRPLSRRLYRFLDKRMRYQDEYEIDIFDLSARLGMQRYKYPSYVKRKLKPALEELEARGYLRKTTFPKRGKYTRVHFVKGKAAPETEEEQGQLELITAEMDRKAEEARRKEEEERKQGLELLREQFGTTEQERDLWQKVLKDLELSSNPATYKATISPARILTTKNEKVIIAVPNPFVKQWLEQRLLEKIQGALNQHLEKYDTVEFVVISEESKSLEVEQKE